MAQRMVDYSKKFRAAAVQAEPTWNDVDAGIDKMIALATEATENGAAIVAFPETWLPGYPWWLWLDSVAWQSQFVVPYAQNSIAVGDARWRRIVRASADLGVALCFGFSERDGASLYISQALVDAGAVRFVRRKLKPTHVERTQFGDGDGSDLVVKNTSLGRVGALNCWEHMQPLTKYAMYAQNEQLHVGAWPSFSIFEGVVTALGPELNTALSRVYAAEGQCFVLAPCGVIGDAALHLFADSDTKRQLLRPGGGHARIYGPDGSDLAAPLAPTEEGILYADIDYARILAAKNAADPVGHYSRPDIFTLRVHNRGRLPKLLLTEAAVAPELDAEPEFESPRPDDASGDAE